ncbi:MAG: flagellar motor protein MotB, partial [Hyphomicrobiales bacterium]
MARKPRGGGGGGAPDWLVTFADLMSLLVCFFVLIISFSIQDKEKLQVVAGSMREAFGVRADS